MTFYLSLSAFRLHLLLPLFLLLLNRLPRIVFLPLLQFLFLDLLYLTLGIARHTCFIVFLFVLFVCHVLLIVLYCLVIEVIRSLCLNWPIIASVRGISYFTKVLHHFCRLSPRLFSNYCFILLFISSSFCIIPHLTNSFWLR